jgi:hypothetical protein
MQQQRPVCAIRQSSLHLVLELHVAVEGWPAQPVQLLHTPAGQTAAATGCCHATPTAEEHSMGRARHPARL